jgi:hypothetical protein
VDRIEMRQNTEMNLTNELIKIKDNYMKVWDEYYETGSRHSAFLKDLVDALMGISAVLEVYTRDKQIYPSYALEKLNSSKSYIDENIAFFEKKLEEEKCDEE